MTIAQFVVTITIALTAIAVALIVGAVFLMEKEQKRGGVLHASPHTEFRVADKGAEIVVRLNRYQMIAWTPVEERLPDNSRKVLVTIQWRNDNERVVSLARYWAGTGWDRCDNRLRIVAWAELPEPYKK